MTAGGGAEAAGHAIFAIFKIFEILLATANPSGNITRPR
jgi:hypothetical protein